MSASGSWIETDDRLASSQSSFLLNPKRKNNKSLLTPLDVAPASTLPENSRFHMPVICIPGCYFWQRESRKFCSHHWLLHLCNWLVSRFHTGWVFFSFLSFFFCFSFFLQTWCWSVGGCFAHGFSICLALRGWDSVFIRKTLHKLTGSHYLIWVVLFLFPSLDCQTSFKGKPSPRSRVRKHFFKPPTSNAPYRQQLS